MLKGTDYLFPNFENSEVAVIKIQEYFIFGNNYSVLLINLLTCKDTAPNTAEK